MRYKLAVLLMCVIGVTATIVVARHRPSPSPSVLAGQPSSALPDATPERIIVDPSRPKDTQMLKPADRDEVLHVLNQNLGVVYATSRISSWVKSAYAAYFHTPFDMVDPGQVMSNDDIIPGVPNKRLIFCAEGRDTAVLAFERGGFVSQYHAVVFWLDSGRTWTRLFDGRSVQNLDALREAVRHVKWINTPPPSKGWY